MGKGHVFGVLDSWEEKSIFQSIYRLLHCVTTFSLAF